MRLLRQIAQVHRELRTVALFQMAMGQPGKIFIIPVINTFQEAGWMPAKKAKYGEVIAYVRAWLQEFNPGQSLDGQDECCEHGHFRFGGDDSQNQERW